MIRWSLFAWGLLAFLGALYYFGEWLAAAPGAAPEGPRTGVALAFALGLPAQIALPFLVYGKGTTVPRNQRHLLLTPSAFSAALAVLVVLMEGL